MSRVSIIILNWNGWVDTIECLESLFQISYKDFNVVIVDNGSKDDSIKKIRDYCSGDIEPISPFFIFDPTNKPIKLFEYFTDDNGNILISDNLPQDYSHAIVLLKNNKNFGFAEGNNIGIRFALNSIDSDYVLLLNNDTVVDSNFLDKLIAAADSDNKIAILGPKVYFYNYNGRSDIIGVIGGTINWKKYPGYFHVGKYSFDTDDTRYGIKESDWISGVAMLLKIKNMPVKFLSNEFFFGCEDVDLSIQIHNQGYKLVVVMESKIWHKGGISRKKRSSILFKRIFSDTLSNFKLFHKHHRYCVWVWFPYLFSLFEDIRKTFFKKKLLKNK